MAGRKHPPLIACVACILALSPLQRAGARPPAAVPTSAIVDVRAFGVGAGSTVVYVASSSGLYRSAAPGYFSWTRQSPISNVDDLAPDPRNSNSVVYAANGVVYRSADGGRHGAAVVRCPPGRPYSGGSLSVLARAPRDPGTIYAGGTCDSVSTIFRSRDGGVTWARVYAVPDEGTSPCGCVVTMAVDPFNSAHILAGDTFYHAGVIEKSTDGGRSWGGLNSVPLGNYYFEPNPATIAFNPVRPQDVWVSWTDGERDVGSDFNATELDHSTTGGRSWGVAGTGLPSASAILAIRWDPLTGRMYVATRSPNGIYATRDGRHFEPFATTRGPAHRQAFDGMVDTAVLEITRDGHILTGDHDMPLTVRPLIGPGNWQISAPFRSYYNAVGGKALLGGTLSPTTSCGRYACQFFDKGRLEDHGITAGPPARRVVYGPIVQDLVGARVPLPVGGDTSTVTYRSLYPLAAADRRVPPPAGFHGGTAAVRGGTFVPYSARLAPAPGYVVPAAFWRYMARADAVPGGWLHDLGLPIAPAVRATVVKGWLRRDITLQAFQRAVLTYDPANPSPFRVERANAGADYARAFPRAAR